MALSPQTSNELQYVEVQSTKHARYLSGVTIDHAGINGDFTPPGTAYGKNTTTGKYAPVTRATVGAGGANAVANTAPYVVPSNPYDFDNFQVGDVCIIDKGETNEETATITAIDRVGKVLTFDSITHDHAEGVVIEKNDGTSTAKAIELNLVDVSDGEDVIKGGINHGGVYKSRMANYDTTVETDLPTISFD